MPSSPSWFAAQLSGAPNKGERGGNGRQPAAQDKLVQMLELASHLTHQRRGQDPSFQQGRPQSWQLLSGVR